MRMQGELAACRPDGVVQPPSPAGPGEPSHTRHVTPLTSYMYGKGGGDWPVEEMDKGRNL
uniref:Uncharacterized protein n=1 Tax=Oryza sativa subsp. japonica TaxID=39947 RepID=Q67TS0_ORYSJ|nr:hypothetical protein [Oryza sativa Japonica Group]BAD38451.1 hypothetical protein [Oryza sativa Japonica Group]